MIKFVAECLQGHLYGFGLTEANLNRLEFNREPLFFDFSYAGHPELFGLIPYLGEFNEPVELLLNLDAVKQYAASFLNAERGVTPESLRVFPITRSVMGKFRSARFWGLSTKVNITNPEDNQLFFAGRDERDIEEYLQQAGLLSPQTKRTYKGFGPQK